MARESTESIGRELERETVTLPRLPPGADEHLRRQRDLAVATLALKERITLQAAADKLDKVLTSVDATLERVLGARRR